MLNLARFCDPSVIAWSGCVVTQAWQDPTVFAGINAVMPVAQSGYVRYRAYLERLDTRAAVRELIAHSDLIVVWEVDDEIAELVDNCEVSIVHVAHRTEPILDRHVRPHHVLAAVSESCRFSFGREHAKSVKAIANGVDINRCASVTPRDTMRAQWGHGPETIVVGFLGRIDANKNLEAIARAIRGLNGKGAGVIYGSESLEAQRVIAMVESIAGSRVQFLPATEDIGDVLHAIDVFMLPSHSEAMSLSLLEAWAAGTPVVATRTGVVPTFESVYGPLIWPVAHDDPEDRLAQAVLDASRSAEARDRARFAQRLVIERFTAHRMAAEWKQLFVEAISRRDCEL